MKIISYGGGVQSTAMIVLATQGRIPDVDVALFANVGDDSEHPATLAYVRDVAVPWVVQRGLPIHEVRRQTRAGTFPTLIETVRGNHVGVVIPARGEEGNPLTRGCTSDFKIAPIARWLREHGASRKNPATVLLGISVDEIERAGRGQNRPHEVRAYPLLDLGLNRDDCTVVIREAGLRVPPKSACWFCPYHSRAVWADMRRDEPDLFAAAQHLEADMVAKMVRVGRRPVYLAAGGLDRIAQSQDTLPGLGIGEDGCDEGVCFV